LNTEVIHMLEEALAKEDRLQLMQQVATAAATEAFHFVERKSREESQ
jgi:hypothetical protein